MAQPHSSSDYLAALQGLMPQGTVWPRDSSAVQTALLRGFATAFAVEDQAAIDLLAAAFPATATALLAEWEATLGLPDPCEGADQTLQQRSAQVLARFASGGGQDVAYLEAVAEGLGYPGVTIQEYAPFRAGVDAAGSPVLDQSWAYTFTVSIPDLRVFYFRPGYSTAGEPLLAVQDNSIGCVIDQLKPAHTLALYLPFVHLGTEAGLNLRTEGGQDLILE